MKELIVIQGTNHAELEQLLHRVAQQLDPEDSITSLQLYSTHRADTFAVRPSRLCEWWDFSDLCCKLKAALANRKDIQLQAWIKLLSDTMNGLPARQMLYIGFKHPSPDQLVIVDPSGNSYEYILYADEEDGEEFVQAEITGKASYYPRPKLQLNTIASINISKKRPAKQLRNLYDRILDTEWGQGLLVILGIVAFFALIIVAILGAWDFSETVLPISIPDLAPLICFAAVGLILALLNVTFKKWNFWGRFVYSTIATAIVTGLLMVAVFSTNRLIPTDHPVAGQGVVTRHIHIEKKDAHNYYIDVITPVKGTIYFGMHGDGTLRIGDTVSLTLRRGIFGMFHTESVN